MIAYALVLLVGIIGMHVADKYVSKANPAQVVILATLIIISMTMVMYGSFYITIGWLLG